MRVGWYVRAGGALGHLLLVAVLALGVFAMHGMGHPSDSAHSTLSTAPHSAATGGTASGHDARSVPGDRAVGGHAPDMSDSTPSPGSSMAMDMESLCVAVLFGAWVVIALSKSAPSRHQEWLTRLLAQVAAVARPEPPPNGPDLTRLSVLRL
ncbi:DUF6153 family protein [Streptomyces sp. NPDC002787]